MDNILSDPDRFLVNENENMRRDGSRLYMQWSNRPLYDDHGNVHEMLCIGIDITAVRQLSRDLIQARKMEAVGNMAGGIAHDFNNTLAGIIGAVELLNLRAREDQRKHLQVIFNAADRATSLIGQMMNFSRKAEGGISAVICT